MIDKDAVAGYRFTPVLWREFGGMQPAATTSCPVSRRCISGCGARRDVFHETVVRLLLEDRTTQELVRLRLLEKEAEERGA